MKQRKYWMAFTLALGLVTWGGCGSSEGIKATDQQNAYGSIEGLGDLAGDEESFVSAFVEGAAPENRKDYAAHGYEINGEGTFDGDTATVPVNIFGVAHSTGEDDRSRGNSGGESGESEQTWVLQRVDGQWLIQDAPLGL